ncbi:MAG TPA: exonuclease domain-containing protein [Puia sp.]|nr:exonuclease domain-containing protein [Puia sp.]
MYAIVDIETTGGYAANNAITEVAIVLHDGNREVGRYQTLVRPGMVIPRYVQALTGITNDMVADAPEFGLVAPTIHEWLKDAVFVAHNVNFDYSFLHHQLKSCGFELNCKKLCTVRLSRKAFPGAPGYSLGTICRWLGIDISNRHRAAGDADATALLFQKILETGGLEIIRGMLKGRNSEQYLPVHLPAGELERLPQVPGVYYFHDQKGKVIYVGKARNLRHRVASHFSNNKTGRQKQEFLRNINSISHETTGTELMAFLLECMEIKRLWPAYNRSMKRFEATYGLYVYEDLNGYSRLILERRKKQLQPVYTFSMLAEGRNILRKLVREFRLCPRLCFIQQDSVPCEGLREHTCDGACDFREPPESYNEKVRTAVAALLESLPSFTLMDRGRHGEEKSCILVERGRFYGMGYLPADAAIFDPSDLKQYLTPCAENDYMRGLIYAYAERWPSKKILLQV